MTIKQFMKNAKPCPFCGGKDLKVTDRKLFDELTKEYCGACVKVECRECDCVKYDFTTTIEDKQPWAKNYGKRLERLLTKWNTRQNDTEDTND